MCAATLLKALSKMQSSIERRVHSKIFVTFASLKRNFLMIFCNNVKIQSVHNLRQQMKHAEICEFGSAQIYWWRIYRLTNNRFKMTPSQKSHIWTTGCHVYLQILVIFGISFQWVDISNWYRPLYHCIK